LIDRHPDARFIIDHMGIQQPSVPPAPPQPWADLPKVVELAKRKNAVIKITGACTLSKEPYPFPDIWDPLARIVDAWGFERCLWGTDWTRAFAVVNYEQAVEPFLKTDRLSDTERAMLMGGACAKAYGWSPKKSLVPHPERPSFFECAGSVGADRAVRPTSVIELAVDHDPFL
jgi:predicted TIM-barrel fold metal-dependent hydrolase